VDYDATKADQTGHFVHIRGVVHDYLRAWRPYKILDFITVTTYNNAQGINTDGI